MTEGLASVVAGLLGGVIQTTPYIGHPAYKKMGGRAAYTLATALFVGAVGFFGIFGTLFEWLPPAAMFPILVFVGLEITAQSFHATPQKHYPAVTLAFLPTLAALALIQVGNALGTQQPAPNFTVKMTTLTCLAGGFIVTSLLWAAALRLDPGWALAEVGGVPSRGGGLCAVWHYPFAAAGIADCLAVGRVCADARSAGAALPVAVSLGGGVCAGRGGAGGIVVFPSARVRLATLRRSVFALSVLWHVMVSLKELPVSDLGRRRWKHKK